MRIATTNSDSRPRLATLLPYGEITPTQYRGLWSGDVIDIDDAVAWHLVELGACVSVGSESEEDGGEE